MTREEAMTQYGCTEDEELSIPFIAVRSDDRLYRVGDTLPASLHQIDGEEEVEELDGTCAIGVLTDRPTPDQIAQWIDYTRNLYRNRNTYLVTGTSATYGWDLRELVIRDCRVLAVIE